ncbi:hypothetical protein FAM22279_01785 [Lacticaseibacillus paracasei]|nr:hypothetical protein FAM22279_01785 [Lacticaseibacillus paracasei]
MLFSFTNKTNCSRGSALSQVCGPNRPETITYSANLEHLFYCCEDYSDFTKIWSPLAAFFESEFRVVSNGIFMRGKVAHFVYKVTNSIHRFFTSAFC